MLTQKIASSNRKLNLSMQTLRHLTLVASARNACETEEGTAAPTQSDCCKAR